MKPARLIVLLIALAAAGGAALLSRGLIPETKEIVKVEEKKTDVVRVLVAAKAIHLGDIVSSGQIKWQDWPKEMAVSGFITDANSPMAMNNTKGAIARAPFLEGEPIKADKLIKANEGGVMAAILSAGMRAVSVEIKERTVAGGFILPNDRVDVLVTYKTRSQQGDSFVSDTILKNVRVLAIGQTIETKQGKNIATGRTATVELTPRQAEMLALADSMGDISLSLRSLADLRPHKGGGPEMKNNPFGDNNSGSIKLLKYGMPSRAYGVN